jgi:hypothetical protein
MDSGKPATSRRNGLVPRLGTAEFQWFEESAFANSPYRRWVLDCLRRVRRVLAGVSPMIPPVSLESVAIALGVKTVRCIPLHVHGRVTRVSEALVVELSDSLAPRAQRFTLAHELAHVVLGDRPAHVTYDDFERVCDLAANEMLLPYEWFREVIDPRRPSLATLVDAARLADCAIDLVLEHALTFRLASFSHTFWLGLSRNRISVEKAYDGFTQLAGGLLKDLAILEKAPFSLLKVLATDGVMRGGLLMTIGGSTRPIEVDCTRLHNGSVLAVGVA